MASSVEALLETIRTANTNISNRLGRLDEHIHAIIQAGEEILRKIRSGGLNDLQITEIREKLEDLRVKTMRNINAKNGRIAEIERIFAELLAAVSPNGQQEEEEEEEEEEEQLQQALQPFSTKTQEQMLSYAVPIRQAFQENPIALQTIQEVYEAFRRGEVDAPRFIHYLRRFVILLNIGAKNLPSEANYTQKGFRALTNILNAKTGYTVSVEPPLPPLSTPADFKLLQEAVPRMLPPKVNIQELLRSQTIAQSDVELYYLIGTLISLYGKHEPTQLLTNQVPPPRNSAFEPAITLLTKESVKLNLQTIPDENKLPVNANNSRKIAHLKTITDGIDSLKSFLRQNETNPINRGLLAYVDTYYTGKPPQTLVGAMVSKHKPILLYILSLANTTVPDFIAGIQVKIPIFDKSDILARKDILGLVIAEFPEGQKTQFEVVQTGIMAELEAAAQRGGYKSRCGCGIPARRTLRGGRRRKTKAATRKPATRKTKPATRKTKAATRKTKAKAKAKTRKSRR
jgi:hypothetical protein